MPIWHYKMFCCSISHLKFVLVFPSRMFPVIHLITSGLHPDKSYHVYVEVLLADHCHWKFQCGKWVSCGNAEPLPQGESLHKCLHCYQIG